MRLLANKLLIVDDNEMNRDMLARRLSRKGYVIGMAESAHGLRERIEAEGIDLVLLDIEMPEISGLDALKSLRQVYSPIQLPVIMVTARNQSEDVIAALELGANDYLTKPIDFPVALARIANQLSHKRAEQALRESEERYALAARGTKDGLWDWNLTENTIYFSARWKAMLGYQENEIGDRPEEWFERIHEADREEVLQRLADHQSGKAPHFESEHRMIHQDGLFRWMRSRGVVIRNEAGVPLRMAGSQTDITEGKVADSLTGLPNRLLFTDRLVRLIERRKRRPEALFAVLFLDLDHFKMINDSLGHVIGDKLLIAVGNRLLSCLRSSDTVVHFNEPFTVARFGGDEFAILLDHVNDSADTTSIAERLLRELALPFHLDDKEVFVSVSIGIALGNSGYLQPDEILRDADTAMYRAKSLGKARYEVFDADMRANILSRVQLEADFRQMPREEFRNYYQPILDLESGLIVGFEALLRWDHPTRGLLEASAFIPVAEDTGLIRTLGSWSLREACVQLRDWRRRYPAATDVTMSVNLSAKQFLQPRLIQDLADLLKELELPGDALRLELTECSVMADPGRAVTILSQIHSLGIRLAIDNFGTGYSSLSYLHRFPLYALKIDRSFTAAMSNGGDGMHIIRSIMTLAANLHLDVVAEGVENAEQSTLLKDLRCRYAQGFHFSRPLTAVEAEQWLAANLLDAPAGVHANLAS